MSLAEIFYARHPRRAGVSHRPRPRRGQASRRNRLLLEPLESRVLLAADPTTLLVPPLADTLLIDPATLTEPSTPPPSSLETSLSQETADGALVAETADTGPYPVPLDAVLPLGSLIHDPVASGSLDTIGETDTFTIDLDAGQTLTLRLTPGDPSLLGRIELLDPVATVLPDDDRPVMGIGGHLDVPLVPDRRDHRHRGIGGR